MTNPRPSPLFLVCLLAACQSGPPAGTRGQQASTEAASPAALWRGSPGADVELAGGTPSRIRTGPHAVVWEQGRSLRPPYTVRATLRKGGGRLHEGYGLLFGGTGLDRAEAEQRYSYFLVRGDGSFLIKRREGEEAPVVRPWTAHPAVPRDADTGGRPVELQVEVGDTQAVFRVGGAEVARVPTRELNAAGYAGLRVSHDVDLHIVDWATERRPAGEGR